MIEIDSAVSYKDVLNIVNPKTGELRHSLMTLKVEGWVKLTLISTNSRLAMAWWRGWRQLCCGYQLSSWFKDRAVFCFMSRTRVGVC